jgi:hypothetical protein
LSNVHTPERLQGESFDAYKARRAQSHAINKANRTAGRGGVSSRQQLRDSMRASGAMGKKTRAYVALLAAWASKVVTKAKLRDEHGAYTEVGARDGLGMRRTWLGGISAQRGY